MSDLPPEFVALCDQVKHVVDNLDLLVRYWLHVYEIARRGGNGCLALADVNAMLTADDMSNAFQLPAHYWSLLTFLPKVDIEAPIARFKLIEYALNRQVRARSVHLIMKRFQTLLSHMFKSRFMGCINANLSRNLLRDIPIGFETESADLRASSGATAVLGHAFAERVLMQRMLRTCRLDLVFRGTPDTRKLAELVQDAAGMKTYWQGKQGTLYVMSLRDEVLTQDVFGDAPAHAILPVELEARILDVHAHAASQYGACLSRFLKICDLYRLAMLHVAYVLQPKRLEVVAQSRVDGAVLWTVPAYQSMRKELMVRNFETRMKALEVEDEVLELRRANLMNVAALLTRAASMPAAFAPETIEALQQHAEILLHE